VLAHKIQEAGMMQSDVCKSLSDCIRDYHRDSSAYGYYIDHDGDGTEGNVVYCCNGDIKQAPYEIGGVAGKAPEASIDFDSAIDVLPVTTYVPEADDQDHYASMESERLYAAVPVYERFISAKTRKAADSGSFAGKGKSFPILKAEDVSAALHSIGRAGPGNYSSDVIRANIKKIAKAKGFALPDSLKDDSDSSERSTWKPEGILLVESSHFCEAPKLQEAATADFPIKLISPGRGSSGYYTPEVLKKAAESNVFKAGTQMFWNHDTDAEESARPEGDLNRLAAVTTTNAQWNESGHDGPGLYARAKVFGDYVEKVREMGPHIGLSIRAGGERSEAAVAPDGKPRVITQLKNAASVDFVTKAGRDGKIFTESATEGDDMDKAEIQALLKESLAPIEAKLTEAQNENKKLREQLAMANAPGLILEALKTFRLPDAGKKLVVERLIPQMGGAIPDEAKLKTLVEAEAASVAKFLTELGFTGGAGFGARMTEAEVTQFTEADGKALTERYQQSMERLTDIFVGPKLPKTPETMAAREARKTARKAFQEGRAA
jgi:hypothetical protein